MPLKAVTLLLGMVAAEPAMAMDAGAAGSEKQITFARTGHMLSNENVWSPDSQWVVYDTRSDPAGDVFDGSHYRTR